VFQNSAKYDRIENTAGWAIMNKYELTTQKKKTAIIQAAISLFRDRGITAVGMKEIASDANVSQASIYNYFGSKEAVVFECLNKVMSATFQKADEVLNREMAYIDKLELALSLCADSLNQSLSEYFSKEALKDKALNKSLLENISRAKREIYSKYIELGKKEGIVDKNIPTNVYLGFMEAINAIGGSAEYGDEIAKNLKLFHHLFLYGIIGKEWPV
jgi:AcrR family transcriptional regulator